MADENDDSNQNDDDQLVALPEGGSTADKISALEKMENGLLTKLYNTDDLEEQKSITNRMDYISSMLDKLSVIQQAVQNAGKKVTQHADGGFNPHDKIRALDVLMEEAAGSGNISEYKMYRTQKRDLISKYGAPGVTTSSTTRNPQIDELKRIANSYQSDACGADLDTRMQAAASAGDMETYKALRSQRKSA